MIDKNVYDVILDEKLWQPEYRAFEFDHSKAKSISEARESDSKSSSKNSKQSTNQRKKNCKQTNVEHSE